MFLTFPETESEIFFLTFTEVNWLEEVTSIGYEAFFINFLCMKTSSAKTTTNIRLSIVCLQILKKNCNVLPGGHVSGGLLSFIGPESSF